MEQQPNMQQMKLTENEIQQKNEYIIKKYEDIRGQLMKEANKEYFNCMQN